jgi:RHS repeat-associated protein
MSEEQQTAHSAHSKAGRLTSTATGQATGYRTKYSYDRTGQLVGATGKESGGATARLHEQMGYAYDLAGNLQYRTDNALLQTFLVNALNELTNVGRSGTMTVAGGIHGNPTNVLVNGVAASLYADKTFAKAGISLADGTNIFTAVAQDNYGRSDTNVATSYLPSAVSLAYDGNGNMTTNGTRFLEYDDDNQPIRITEPGAWKSAFTYDGKMRRRERWESVWDGSKWVTNLMVRYIYDGLVSIQERHYNPQLSTSYPQLIVAYTRGRDLNGSLQGAGGIGGLLARTESGPLAIANFPPSALYHCDTAGNITCLVGTNSQVQARYLYEPFGSIIALSGRLAERNLYRFSSKEWHQNSSLVYYAFRYYSPSLQRWVSRDRIGERGGINLHAFVGNAPPHRFDPLGQSWLSWCASWACIGAVTVGLRDDLTQAGIDWSDDVHGGNGFLHCLAACSISRSCPKQAEGLWDGRENPSNPTSTNQQDLNNNHIGFGLAASEGSCWDNCMTAWQHGGLSCEGGRTQCPPPDEYIPPRPRPGAP